MGGVLWWLLAAVVSGSWLVMLALVLSLAAVSYTHLTLPTKA